MESMNKVLLVFCLCFAVAAAQSNYRFLTWNTQGQRWPQVTAYLNRYDVLCIQESGALGLRGLQALNQNNIDYRIVDEDNRGEIVTTSGFNGGVEAYTFSHGNVPYYVYYYNHLVETHAARVANNDRRTRNMAIITRERASKVYIIPAHSRDPYRIDVNRPTIGVKLSGYTVFTAHSDPNKNEIVDTIGKVARFMASENQCQQTKWILMGDFNEEPAVVNRRLPQASNGCVISIVSPAAATRQASGKIIDYGVYGGPPSTAGSLQATTRTGEGNSDHWPVQIMPAPMNG